MIMLVTVLVALVAFRHRLSKTTSILTENG